MSLFYTQQFDNLDNQNYYYGNTPNEAVAEQNQTYIAYFDGVGGTGPEVIDQTAYFIKYLIDTEGNVVNPEPNTVTNRPQAIALYNLVNNFEVGKQAVVKLIEPNPMLDEIPNGEILTGIHPITYVGRIVPILITETGINPEDYLSTMSFAVGQESNITSIVENVGAQFTYDALTSSLSDAPFTDLAYPTTDAPYTNLNAWDNLSPIFRILSSSQEANTRIKIEAKIYVKGAPPAITFQGGGNPHQGGPQMQITRFPSTFRLRLLRNNNEILLGPLITYGDANLQNGYYTLTSDWLDYSANDQFKIQYTVANNNDSRVLTIHGGLAHPDSRIRVTQEVDPNVIIDDVITNVFTEGINAKYLLDGYIAQVTNQPDSTGGFSILYFDPGFLNLFESNVTQINPSSSLNFSNINIPFGDTKPGDFIRFEYNKNQVFTIIKIETAVLSGNSVLTMTVMPSLSSTPGDNTQTMDTNHFVIYRCLNDGSYVVLNIKKDAPGGAYSGILQPKFTSQELVNKYDKIITDLTEREIIN